MNSAVDPFLMKKLLKSGICGSVNSARMHFSPSKSQLLRAKQKKKKRKKKREKHRTETQTPKSFESKRVHNLFICIKTYHNTRVI